MAGRPRVTICVRTFERPNLLARAIGCLSEQTFEDWEGIVVNNGGEPSEVDRVIGAHADRHGDRVRALHLQQPVLIGEAASIGLGEGSGEYVTLLDDDDTWLPQYLEESVAQLDHADTDVAAVACRVRRVWERVGEDGSIAVLRDEPFNPNLATLNFQSEFISHPISTNSLMVRRAVFEELGGYSSTYETGDDVHFLLNLLARYRVEVIPRELGARHERVDSEVGRNMTDDALRVRDNDARYRDEFTEQRMRSGEISPAEVALTISHVDRKIHSRIDETLDHLRESRLHAGDTLHNAEHAKQQLDGYYSTFRAFGSLMAPVVWLRRIGGRVVRGRSA